MLFDDRAVREFSRTAAGRDGAAGVQVRTDSWRGRADGDVQHAHQPQPARRPGRHRRSQPWRFSGSDPQRNRRRGTGRRKRATLVLLPVSSRKQLVDLSDEMATKVKVLFYWDVREAFVKAIAD